MTREEILKPYIYMDGQCESIEKEDALKAMQLYADQQIAELKAEIERLKYHKECNKLIRKAFEEGIVVGNGGKRGNTSLWGEYVDRHFMNFMRPYLNIENNQNTKQ